MHSSGGPFSKYLYHTDTFRAKKRRLKNGQNFDNFSVFFNKIDILK